MNVKKKIPKTSKADIRTVDPLVLPAHVLAEKEFTDMQRREKQIQAEIDAYNESIGVIDPVFSKKEFFGNDVIVRLLHNNFLTTVSSDSLGEVQVKSARMIEFQDANNPEHYHLVVNPLDYLYIGIVVALPKTLQVHMAENGMDIKVGDWVELSWIDLQSARYYPDKRKIDVVSPREALEKGEKAFPNFEGYFKVNYNYIECKI